MSDIIGSLTDSANALKKRFNYGPHPSVIMWAAGNLDKVEEAETSALGKVVGAVDSARKAMEGLVVSGTPENFNSFKFDAMVSESHDAQTRVTKKPTSTGFVVADHIINENRILKLEAVAVNMQNSSMGIVSVQGLSVITGAVFDNPVIPEIGGLFGVVSSAFETEDRIQSTYNLFNGLRTSGTKLYISTILGTYLNCVITGIRTRHDRMTSAMLAVEITLEETQVVGSDALADAAKVAIQNSYDYSEFSKMATSLGIGILGGVPLPGLGSISRPTAQLAVLKDKVAKLSQPISSVKGRLL